MEDLPHPGPRLKFFLPTDDVRELLSKNRISHELQIRLRQKPQQAKIFILFDYAMKIVTNGKDANMRNENLIARVQ